MDRAPSSWLRWFALAVMLPLGTFFCTTGVMSIPPNSQGVDIVEGRDLFRAHCGSCHFAKVGFPAHQGPNLHEIGRTGALRKPNMTAPQYILESILDPPAFVAPSSRPGMPRNVAAELPPEKLRDIVGFLASCGAYPDYDQITRLEIPDRRTPDSARRLVSFEDMELAEKVLRDNGGCLKCHSRHHVPESQVYAPSIFNAGLADPVQLRESILNPNKEIKLNYHSVDVVLENGKVLSGKLMSRTDDQLIICARDEKGELALREILLADVEKEGGQPLIEQSKLSMMPTEIDKILTTKELEALLTLIHQLN